MTRSHRRRRPLRSVAALAAAGLAIGGCSNEGAAPSDVGPGTTDIAASGGDLASAPSRGSETGATQDMADHALPPRGATEQERADSPTTQAAVGENLSETTASSDLAPRGAVGDRVDEEPSTASPDLPPGPLDEAGALACANVESGLYRMQAGDISVAGEKMITAREWVSSTADERLRAGGRALIVELADDGWESSVRAFLEICRNAGYQPL